MRRPERGNSAWGGECMLVYIITQYPVENLSMTSSPRKAIISNWLPLVTLLGFIQWVHGLNNKFI
jgi:hypothetical protein